ncbi:MAG: hypothetical protein JZU63_03085, partial [Rhodoferax sp.]|nr:hypothetical protein [Rhodoferax sp.]
MKSARGIRVFAEEQSLLLTQRNTLELRQAETALALTQASERVASLSKSMVGVASDVQLFSETQRSDAIENARRLLLDLPLKERDLSTKFVDSNPLVQDIRADIKRTNEYIRDLESKPPRVVRSGRSPARDVVESDLLRAMADKQQARAASLVLTAQRAAIEERLAVFAAADNELPALERERRFAEVNYDAAAKRLRDELALEELDRKRLTNVSVVQAPVRPLHAKSLKPVILVVGTFLSICA